MLLKPRSLGPAGRLQRPSPPLRTLQRLPQRRVGKITSPGPQHPLHRHVARQAGPQPGPPPPPPPPDTSINVKKGFWTFVDIVAILGSVGGALAAILNLFSGTYVLFLPLVLPVVSLLSALQREGLIAEDNRRAYDTLRVSLARDSSGLLADARGAIEEVRRELRGQNTTAARLATIEARLSSLEGSILSAGRSAREASAGLGLLPERLAAEQRAVLEGLLGAMRAELRRAAESLANNETTALARLDARLAAVEGSLSGLEVAQSEGMRRLSLSLNSALADAEASLQSGVRNEVARSMEPVRRLPQMLAAALPPALAAAEAVEASIVGGPAAGPGALGGGAGGVSISPEQLQAIIGAEVEGAVGRILDYQAEAFGRLSAVRPMPLDEEQWAALGRRLSRLERLVESVPAGTEGALLQGGGLTAALAAAARDAAAAAAAEARSEAAAAAAREAEGVRREVAAAQSLLRESLEGLAAVLAPLELGVSELQATVTAVSEQQRRQLELAEAAAATAAAAGAAAEPVQRQREAEEEGEEGEEAALPATVTAVAPPPPSAAELSRLLEGVAAVAQLLREVDSKMDGVAAAVAALPQEVAAVAAAAAPPPPSEAPAAAAEAPDTGAATAAAAEAAAAAAEAAEAAKAQQLQLQSGIDSLRETLTALTAQVGALATQSQAAAAAATAPPSAPAAAAPDAISRPSPAAADVLSFEASLASAAADAAATSAPEAERGGGRAPPATAGASREEAYDMMLALAEARRRSGEEASVSASGATGATSNGGVGASGGEGGSGQTGHLRIVGLPPFEDSGGEEQRSPAASGAAAAPAEAATLPPSQQLQQQQQQQGAEYGDAGGFQGYGYGYGEASTPQGPPFGLRGAANGWQQQQQQQEPQTFQQQAPYGYYDTPQASSGYGEQTDASMYGQPPSQPPPYWQTAAAPQQPAGAAPPNGRLGTSQPPPPSIPTMAPTVTVPDPRAAPPPPSPGYSPLSTPPVTPNGYTPSSSPPSASPFPSSPLSPQQPPQQAQAYSPPYTPAPSRLSALPPLPPPSASASAPLPLPDLRPRPLEGLSPTEMISEGLRLLRLGREETRKGEDYGQADSLLQAAVAAFSAASQAAPGPGDAKALGNLGNALLARGELKAAYLEALRAGPPPSSLAEAEAQAGAEGAMSAEANALLTEAGLMFMKVLEMEGWSSRALVNWGRALVIRGDLLASQPEGLAPGGPLLPAVAQLYSSAISKFEGVLEGEPDMVPAKYRCALAMAGLARTRPAPSRERATLLGDAVNYLRDVVASPHPDAEALRPAAAAALAACEAQLAAARAARQQQ